MFMPSYFYMKDVDMCKFIEKMKSCPKCRLLFRVAKCKINFLETWGVSVTNLVIRFWIGLIFWRSGATKVYGDSLFGLPNSIDIFGYKLPLISFPYTISDSTYMLYEYEYDVPYLSPEFAALSSTFAEIFLSLMLFLGFGARIAAAGFIIMTLVINYTYEVNAQHFVWIMLLMVILTNGAGKFSVDNLLRKKILDNCTECKK